MKSPEWKRAIPYATAVLIAGATLLPPHNTNADNTDLSRPVHGRERLGNYSKYDFGHTVGIVSPGDTIPRELKTPDVFTQDYIYPDVWISQDGEQWGDSYNLRQVTIKGHLQTTGSTILVATTNGQDIEGTDFDINFTRNMALADGLTYHFPLFSRVLVKEGAGGLKLEVEIYDAANGNLLYARNPSYNVWQRLNQLLFAPIIGNKSYNP